MREQRQAWGDHQLGRKHQSQAGPSVSPCWPREHQVPVPQEDCRPQARWPPRHGRQFLSELAGTGGIRPSLEEDLDGSLPANYSQRGKMQTRERGSPQRGCG